MAADRTDGGVETPEELREVIFAQRRELDTLRRDFDDAALLISALDSLLDVDGGEDPFTAVLTTLEGVFECTHALTLAETGEPGSPLRCIFASVPGVVGAEWEHGRILEKVLAGRVTATLTGQMLGTWPAAAWEGSLSPEQPALYLPVGFRDRRGLMMLLRAEGAVGFDRRHIALGRKFAVLASHAFATRAANRSESERRRLQHLTDELRDVQAELAHRANHDELTGLPNRALLAERMNRALEARDRRVALAFIDLDGFKQVNDVYGHEVGDRLLIAVAERLRGQVRGSDLVARLGGDEFVLLIDPVEDEHLLDRIIARLVTDLKEPFALDGTEVLASASVGLAIYPDHGSSYDELRRNADVAMYRAKTTSRGSVAYFDREMGRVAAERSGREQVLRAAIHNRRFCCVLQPKIDIRNVGITGFEALARRVDRDGTLRAPDEFIALAAELGLLDEITALVIDDIVRWLPKLDERFGRHATISLNVSATQATKPATMQALLARLAATGQSERFIVELTEDAILTTDIFEREVVPLFRETAIRVSIDDFGTGYASLATLLDITPEELKVDRAFIQDVPDRARSQIVLEAIAAVGHSFGIDIVAEGVETAEELDYLLRQTPIRTVQGYLFSRPLPADELIASYDELTGRLDALRAMSLDVERAEAHR